MDLETPITKTDVDVSIVRINESILHPKHVAPNQHDLCAPRGATITRLWNTEANVTTTKNSTSSSSSSTSTVVQTSQFLVLGGSRSEATTSADTSWTIPSHSLIGHHGDAHSTSTIARLLTRDLVRQRKRNSRWDVYENLTLGARQTQELMESHVATFYGHSTVLFGNENFVVVYGGATADNMLLPEGVNAWVLWLGEPNQGGLQRWAEQGRRSGLGGGRGAGSGSGSGSARKSSATTATAAATTTSTRADMELPGDDEGSGRSGGDRSDRTTTSGTSDTSGGSDSDLSGSTRFHPVGLDLRSKGNEELIANHPRSSLRWEYVSIQWPEAEGSDANAERIGHACARYGEWLYVLGGCAEAHQYKADVFRIRMGEKVLNSSGQFTQFAFQNEGGCQYERCDPVQKYAALRRHMMTPRSGHTVMSRGSNMYIYGGGTDGFVVDRAMYVFDAESYVVVVVLLLLLFFLFETFLGNSLSYFSFVADLFSLLFLFLLYLRYAWNCLDIEGPIPPGRFNHAACMAGGSLANKMVISGGIGNIRPTAEDVLKYQKKMKNSRERREEPDLQHRDRVLSDVWTFDFTAKVWSEIKVPGMAPMYGHLMCMYDNRDTKMFLYGGGDSNEGGHSLEIDLVPSWSQKQKKARKRMESKSKKSSTTKIAPRRK